MSDDDFAKLPLQARMRLAADVLAEVTVREGRVQWPEVRVCWSPAALRGLADSWEREDADKLGRDRIVEELAAEVFTYWAPGFDTDGMAGAQNLYREKIRAMLDKHPHIAEGWPDV